MFDDGKIINLTQHVSVLTLLHFSLLLFWGVVEAHAHFFL